MQSAMSANAMKTVIMQSAMFSQMCSMQSIYTLKLLTYTTHNRENNINIHLQMYVEPHKLYGL